MGKPQAQTNDSLDFPSQSVSFDPEAFDELIRTQGVDMVHWQAMPCPVGLIDADDNRHPNDHHVNCSNGFIYDCAGTVICLWQGNSKELKQIDLGRMDGSTVNVTFPRFYEKDAAGAPDVPVAPLPFDRLYLKDEKVTVETWERFNASGTGLDKLRFPITCIVRLRDSDGKSYSLGSDFNVAAGKIQWIQGHEPPTDPQTKKGLVCSVRYRYRPFWYVQRLMHEVRVAQVENEFTGERETMRFPQSMVLQREMVFENEQRDRKVKETARTTKAPDDRDYTPSVDDLGTR